MVTKKDKFLAAAQKFLEKGSLDKALAEFMRAVQEDPKDTRTWLRIAEIHVKRGENDKATEVYLKTADLYVEQGFFQRAVAVYKNIIKLSPGFVEAYTKLADIYRQLGLLSDAVQQYEQAAAVLQKSGNTKAAMAAMRQIVEINPEQPVARIKLAEAASQAGMADEAVAEFTRAAELLKAQGRTDEYLRVAERLIYHRPDDVVLAKEVARQYIERNNGRFALAKLQACFKQDPRDTETLDLLARAFQQLGQAQKTVSVLKELAKVHADSGRVAERGAVAQRILAIDPNDADARQMLQVRGGMPSMSAPAPVRAPAAPVAPMAMAPSLAPSAPLARGVDITFSEMAVPHFLQPGEVDVPMTMGAPERRNTAERVAIANNMLERTEDEAATDVNRIIAEADTFVKYGLTERAVDHLRRVFEFLPTHVGAHERLASILMQLGRDAEAVTELEVLAEQLASTEPEAAADHARRALSVDPRSRRARRVLDSLEGASVEAEADVELEAETSDEYEELSTGLVEVIDDVEPEAETQPEGVPSPSFASVPGDDFLDPANEGGTMISPSFMDDTSSFATPDAVELSARDDEATDTHSTAASEPTNEEPMLGDDFAPSSATVAVPGDENLGALLADLEQVDFFLEQGLADEARTLIDDIEARNPLSPLVDERRTRLRELEEASAPGAVPSDRSGGTVSRAFDGPAALTPRAMVAAGGEMDIATHRDIGIGYKEMGLYDAAINEFTILTQDPSNEVFALTMIGECQEAKGSLPDAVAAYKKALNRPNITDAEATQLYYQLGSAFQALGDRNEAQYFYDKVAKRDPNFREVRNRLAEVRAASTRTSGGTEPNMNDIFGAGAVSGAKNRR